MKFQKSFAAATALLSAGVLMAGGIDAAFAQKPANKPGERQGAERGRGPGGGGAPGLRMLANLDLTDAQKAKIKPILEKYQAKFKALTPEERRTKGRELHQAMVAEIKPILTAAQQAKLEEARQKRGRGGERGKGPGGQGGQRPGGKTGQRQS